MSHSIFLHTASRSHLGWGISRARESIALSKPCEMMRHVAQSTVPTNASRAFVSTTQRTGGRSASTARYDKQHAHDKARHQDWHHVRDRWASQHLGLHGSNRPCCHRFCSALDTINRRRCAHGRVYHGRGQRCRNNFWWNNGGRIGHPVTTGDVQLVILMD